MVGNHQVELLLAFSTNGHRHCWLRLRFGLCLCVYRPFDVILDILQFSGSEPMLTFRTLLISDNHYPHLVAGLEALGQTVEHVLLGEHYHELIGLLLECLQKFVDVHVLHESVGSQRQPFAEVVYSETGCLVGVDGMVDHLADRKRQRRSGLAND